MKIHYITNQSLALPFNWAVHGQVGTIILTSEIWETLPLRSLQLKVLEKKGNTGPKNNPHFFRNTLNEDVWTILALNEERFADFKTNMTFLDSCVAC